MTWLLFTLAALATFRTAILISLDDGPANVIKKARTAIPRRSSAWKGIRCFRCCSVLVAIPITALLWHLGLIPAPLTPIYALAISGAAMAINRTTT